jgi:hypothetical protein
MPLDLSALGSIAPAPQLPDATSGIQAALAQNQALHQQQIAQQSAGPRVFGSSGLANFLGRLGDALLVGTGHDPIYAPMLKDREAESRKQHLGTALANYLGDSDSALAEIFRADPEVGIDLYKIQHPASEVPSGLKEFQYYQGLDPTTRAAYEKFLQITHPAMMAPITLGPNDTYDPGGGATAADGLPTVSDQASYDAVPAGGKYKDPQGNIRTKGGQSGGGSAGGFL